MENRSIKELIKKVGQSFTKWETVCKKKTTHLMDFYLEYAL